MAVNRSTHSLGLLWFVALLSLPALTTARAEMGPPVRIGYAVSASGPAAAGTAITTAPNYRLWVRSVNREGGLRLPDGSRRLISVIEYDDRSDPQELARAIERLALVDEVDFILPPWGTSANFAVAPLLDRFGYPHLCVTCTSDRIDEHVVHWPRSFWFLGEGRDYADALAGLLADARDDGRIGDKVAMVSVADGFGVELAASAREAFAANGLGLVQDETYPPGTRDFGAMIAAAAASGADTFVAMSYPPDTFALTAEARRSGYSPKVFYTGVGAAFPAYPRANANDVEGVTSLGGVENGATMRDYFTRHAELIGSPPDSWASAPTWASLQILRQAIERRGLDREAVSREISRGRFETVLGDVQLENNQLRDLWRVGQWQDGRFVGVAPRSRPGAAELRVPGPEWGP